MDCSFAKGGWLNEKFIFASSPNGNKFSKGISFLLQRTTKEAADGFKAEVEKSENYDNEM